jgi:ribosomal protein S12 methylthiotransferase
VRDLHPSVLAVTGPHACEDVLAAVHAHLPRPHDPFQDLVPPQGVKLTPRHYAYLEDFRGLQPSLHLLHHPATARRSGQPAGRRGVAGGGNLVRAGVRELLVVSQDTSAYGVDVRYRTGFWNGRPLKTHLTALVATLGELGAWVRLHYVYPYPHVDEVVPLMAEGKLVPYLDVPLQHASPRILKAMKRPANAGDTLERVRRWRDICPDLTLRSTFIVGFPGETEGISSACWNFSRRRNWIGSAVLPTRRWRERRQTAWPIRFPRRSSGNGRPG